MNGGTEALMDDATSASFEELMIAVGKETLFNSAYNDKITLDF